MVSKTFEGTVVGGQLAYNQPLHVFEGKKVLITVIDPVATPTRELPAESTDEPPDDLDVEKEIYNKMPRKVEMLKGVTIIDKGRRRPHVILPEELPND